MFRISMAKDPAVSLLYTIIAMVCILLSISQYIFGHYDIMFLTMIMIGILLPGAIFLFLNREQSNGKYVNVLILISLGTIMQYQLSIDPDLSIHFAFSFPIICYFILPISWAIQITFIFMVLTFYQVSTSHSMTDSLRLCFTYLVFDLSSFCYAYINTVKRQSLLNLTVTDYQSGAYNNRHLVEKLNQEIARSAVTKRTLSLVAVTIEDYGQILDIHGTNISERLLKEFHYTVNGLLRAGDDVFHDCKGTFYILLPNCPIEGALVLKERLFKKIASIQWQDIGDIQLNIGFATLESSENAQQFLQRASEHLVKQQKTALRLLAFDK
ncbi:MAG: diguanylate cyclase (GGDEF)-like protein [Psychrobacter glaciei]|jgi:diguanylate cyclase (GGDEF)-like protein